MARRPDGDLGAARPRRCLRGGISCVLDPERDRRAERLAVADAAEDFDLVALDLHPPAAAVAALAPREIDVDVVRVQPHSGGHAGHNGLRSLDAVAYVRFASVYRDFREARDFNAIIDELEGGGGDLNGDADD